MKNLKVKTGKGEAMNFLRDYQSKMKFYTASVRTVVKFRVAFELARAANNRAARTSEHAAG